MENHPQLPRWLDWAREIQAIAQNGQLYALNDFQSQRYLRLTAIAAEMIQEHSDLAFEPLQASFQAELGYATPKVDVRAAVFRDDSLLMVRERSDDGWTLPGGWVDVGDRPSQAAERETWEESGYRVRAFKLIGVYDANRVGELALHHAFKLLFLCEWLEGLPSPSNETSEVAFFKQAEIPPHLSEHRTTPRQIADAFTAWKNPDVPTLFD